MSDTNEHLEKHAEPAAEATGQHDVNINEDKLSEAIEGMDETVSDGAEKGFSNPLEALAAENARQEEEISNLKDQNLRLVAEMENLRRRTQKDVANARSFSISRFAGDMLGVADNLHRAIEHVEETDKEHAGFKNLIEGIAMTGRELQNALEKNGVKKINPENERFDPNFHQAMFEIPDDSVANNTVLQVTQIGYVIGERVLRPAMVGVSKSKPQTDGTKGGE